MTAPESFAASCVTAGRDRAVTASLRRDFALTAAVYITFRADVQAIVTYAVAVVM